MLTPDQISALRDTAGQLADPINNYLLADIARRIAEAGQLTSTASYQIWRAQQLGISQAEIKKRLRKLMKKTAEEVDSLLKQTAKVGYEFDLQNFPHAEAVPFSKNTSIQQMVTMVAEMTDGELTNITKTLGMVDPYGNAFPLQEIYRRTMDYAFNEVYYGAADYQTTIRRVTSKLARYGVRVIDYKNGKHTSLEATVRRNVMGGIGLLQEEISQYNYDELGADGWEISAHAASAPDHEPIQGRQYSNESYEKLNSSLKRRIGTLNCGHVAFPIILGVSEPQYTEEQLQQLTDDNKKGITYQGKQYTMYEATQKQRELERQIRAQKRQVMVVEAAGDEANLVVNKTRLRILNREYKQFSTDAGIPMQHERTEVAGFNVSDSSKNNPGLKNYLKDPEISATIKVISGGRITNQYSKSAKEHAKKYYGLVRSMKTDVANIAKNTGFSEDDISRIKSFIFLEKHSLGGIDLEYFEPDFAMAQSWQRLIYGNAKPHDFTLLHHEIIEKSLMDSGLSQAEAHEIASQKHNYGKESDEYYASLKKHRNKP